MDKNTTILSNSKSDVLAYIKGIDILRFIAATGVILHHVSLVAGGKRGIATPFLSIHKNSGSFFLNLFFVISGYLITAILFKELDANKFSIKNFFIRRILRIWPLYFFSILVFVILIPLLHAQDGILKNTIFASLFLTNFQLIFYHVSKSTYQILWSVGIEEQIYVLFPLLILLFKEKRTQLLLVLVVIGYLSWKMVPGFIESSPNRFNPAYLFTTSYFYLFGIGGLIATLSSNNKKTSVIDLVLLNPIFQIFILILGFGMVFNLIDIGKLSQNFNLLFNGVFPAYLVYCAIKGKLLIDCFNPKVSKFLGNVSYPMYLVHVKVITLCVFLIRKIENPSDMTFDLILTGSVLILTIGLSALLHQLVEKPFLKIKKKYTAIPNKD